MSITGARNKRNTILETSRSNSFDGLRLLAALAVIVGHGWAIRGQGEDAPRLGLTPLHALAVEVFFAVSGYLIAQSWMRDPNLLRYLSRRALRIFPALALVLLVTVMVIGPVFTDHTEDYWGSTETWRYLGNISLVVTYSLPGVFSSNHTEAVNGSLWSLGPEFVCYLLLAGTGLLALRALKTRLSPQHCHILLLASLGAVFAVFAFLPATPAELAPSARAMVFFAGGAILARVFDQRRMPVWLLTGASVTLLLGHLASLVLPPRGFEIPWAVLLWFALPVFVIGVGQRPTPILQKAGRFGDFSYGLYLWGYPIQQALLAGAPNLAQWVSTTLVVALALAVSVLSWHFVERPALSLKPSTPTDRASTRRASAPR